MNEYNNSGRHSFFFSLVHGNGFTPPPGACITELLACGVCDLRHIPEADKKNNNWMYAVLCCVYPVSPVASTSTQRYARAYRARIWRYGDDDDDGSNVILP